MNRILCLREYGETVRPYLKKKSIFKVGVGQSIAKKEPVDGTNKFPFYSMLFDSLSSNATDDELGDKFSGIDSPFSTRISNGNADIPSIYVELAQKDDATTTVAEYFDKYLIPNIPPSSIDYVNDRVVALIKSDNSVGQTTQEKLISTLSSVGSDRVCQGWLSDFLIWNSIFHHLSYCYAYFFIGFFKQSPYK